MRRGLLFVTVLFACRAHGPASTTTTTVTTGSSEVVVAAASLVVTQPARGAFVDSAPTIVVGGTVTGGRAPKVTVNGVDAMIGPGGTFALAVPVTPGMAILETHVRDGETDVRDVRAALVGPFARADGSAPAPVAVRVAPAGLAAIATALGASAKAIDFTAAARAAGPVFDEGDCLGARVTVDRVAVDHADASLVPQGRVLAATIDLAGVVARFAVHYEVACLGGDAFVTVRTRAHVTGDLGALLALRHVRTSLARTQVALDDLELDIDHVPGPIERLLRRALRTSVERALARTLEQEVPPLVDGRLAQLLAAPLAPPPLLGHALAIDVAPNQLAIDQDGLYLAADTKLVVDGGAAGRYVAHAARLPAPAPKPTDAVELWVAIDAIDQLLAGLHAAHAFDRTIEVSQLGALAFVLGGKLATIELSLPLPPTASLDHDTVALAIGDLVVVARDADHREVQRFAVSVRTALAPGANGAIALAAAEPTIFAQNVSTAAGGPLDATALEMLARTAWGVLAAQLDDALVRIPLPAVPGRTLALRALPSTDGVAAFGASLK